MGVYVERGSVSSCLVNGIVFMYVSCGELFYLHCEHTRPRLAQVSEAPVCRGRFYSEVVACVFSKDAQMVLQSVEKGVVEGGK